MLEAEWLTNNKLSMMLSFIENRISRRKLILFASACCQRIWHLLLDERSRAAVKMSDLYADKLIIREDLELAWNSASQARSAYDEKCERQELRLQQVVDIILTREAKEHLFTLSKIPRNIQIYWGRLLARLDSTHRASFLAELGTRLASLEGGQEVIKQLELVRIELESTRNLAARDVAETYFILRSLCLAAVAATRLAFVAQLEEENAEECFTSLINSVAKYAAEAASLSIYTTNYNDQENDQCCLLREIIGNPFQPSSLSSSWIQWNGGIIVETAEALYESQTASGTIFVGDLLKKAGCRDESILNHCWGKEPHVKGCWVLDLILSKANEASPQANEA